MTRFKRRMLFGLTLVVLVVLGFGAWVYFYGTRITLERAEAFQFRRMVVAQLEEQGVYRFFYVSNRRLGPGDGPLEERFGTEREEILKFGSFDTGIKPTLVTPLTALKHPAHCADTVLSHPCPTASKDARHNRLRCQ